jgi:hypothetical protein
METTGAQWGRDSIAEVEGPALEQFATLFRDYGVTPEGDPTVATFFLIARTIAAMGRACASIQSEDIDISIASFPVVSGMANHYRAFPLYEVPWVERPSAEQVLLQRFSLPYEAHIAASRLDDEGIQAVIADEQIVAMNWLWSNAVGGVKLMVSNIDLEIARQVLAERPAPPSADEGSYSFTCPHCHGNNTSYLPGQPPGRIVAGVFAAIFLTLPIPSRHDSMKCDDCGEIWKVDEPRQSGNPT